MVKKFFHLLPLTTGNIRGTAPHCRNHTFPPFGPNITNEDLNNFSQDKTSDNILVCLKDTTDVKCFSKFYKIFLIFYKIFLSNGDKDEVKEECITNSLTKLNKQGYTIKDITENPWHLLFTLISIDDEKEVIHLVKSLKDANNTSPSQLINFLIHNESYIRTINRKESDSEDTIFAKLMGGQHKIDDVMKEYEEINSAGNSESEDF